MGINHSAFNIFSKLQQSILRLLYLNTASDYFTNEIIRLANCGTGAVQRELKKLTEAGLITQKKFGNQVRYQANQNLPYFEELKSIIIKTFGLADIIAEKICFNQEIKLAFIYGSFAKGTYGADSDVDLMLIGEDLTYAEFFQTLNDVEQMLGYKINPSFYSPTEWQRKYKAGNHFIRSICEQPKIFLIGTKDEFDTLR